MSLLPEQGPPKPVPTLTGDIALLDIAKQFQRDCVVHLSQQECVLPHRITLGYFSVKKHPDKRGYAEIWGRKNVIHWVDVRVAEYLTASLWKDGLLVTMYHELFHAWFQLDHDDSSLGIMNATAYFEDDLTIAKDFNYYVAKEFDRVKHK